MFFLMAALLLKSMSHHTMFESLLNLFGLIASPRTEQQRLSFNKFSLNLPRYQKAVVAAFLYPISGARSKKKQDLGSNEKYQAKKKLILKI